MKFDLHQSIPLKNEERRMCMNIESSLSPIEEHASMFFKRTLLRDLNLWPTHSSPKSWHLSFYRI